MSLKFAIYNKGQVFSKDNKNETSNSHTKKIKVLQIFVCGLELSFLLSFEKTSSEILLYLDTQHDEIDSVPIAYFANLNLRSGRPGGRFNLTKFDDNFEKVIGDIYDLDASSIPKHHIIYTIMEPTNSNPNWTLHHGMYFQVVLSQKVIEITPQIHIRKFEE